MTIKWLGGQGDQQKKIKKYGLKTFRVKYLG